MKTELEKTEMNGSKKETMPPQGYEEILSAIANFENYMIEFNFAMDRGDGDCPAKPKENIEELKLKYPLANMYILAEDYAASDNYDKAGFGNKALKAIKSGADITETITKMKKDWSDAAERAMWNS